MVYYPHANYASLEFSLFSDCFAPANKVGEEENFFPTILTSKMPIVISTYTKEGQTV